MHEETIKQWDRDNAGEPQIAPEGIECPKHVAIVGLGLIGGSLARRLRESGCHVSAWNHRDHPYANARAAGIDCKDTLEELVAEEPDVLMLCNPLVAMPQVLQTIKPIINPQKTTLSDVGSVKGPVHTQVSEVGLLDCYVGAHPMAGNEHSGWVSADPTLFNDALWAVTFGPQTQYRRVVQIAGMITRGVRNTMIVIDDVTHDCEASLISHMPHVLSTALINEMTSDTNNAIASALSAGSWRDMTRVALTDPDRTRVMVIENAHNVEELLHRMIDRLSEFADALHEEDETEIRRFFAEGQPYRDYKAQTNAGKVSDSTETIFQSLRIDPEHWREQLLKSAQRGEYIVRFTSGHRLIAEQRPSIHA